MGLRLTDARTNGLPGKGDGLHKCSPRDSPISSPSVGGPSLGDRQTEYKRRSTTDAGKEDVRFIGKSAAVKGLKRQIGQTDEVGGQ